MMLQNTIMLQPPDDDAGTDSDPFGKVVNRFVGKLPIPYELAEGGRRNQRIGCKAA